MMGKTWFATAARISARRMDVIVPSISDTSAGLQPAATAMSSRVMRL